MYKVFAWMMGVAAMVTALIATWSEMVGYTLVIIGVACLAVGFFKSAPEVDKIDKRAGWMTVGFGIFALGVGGMPMDGSWLLLGFGLALSLTISTVSIIMLREWQKDGTCEYFALVVTAVLPILGLGLVHYLLHTDRSIVSGLIIIVVLTWIASKIAPTVVPAEQQPARPKLRLVA